MSKAGSTEVGSSLTAVAFYQKMGNAFKNGIAHADAYGVVRLEKRKERCDEQALFVPACALLFIQSFWKKADSARSGEGMCAWRGLHPSCARLWHGR